MVDGADPGSKDDGSPLKNQLELLKFLREEAEANRSAQREESDANRKLLRDMFWIASPVLTIVIAVSSVLLAHDLNTFKQSLKLEAEADTKLEIEKENQKIEKEIEDTLQQQFQTGNIRSTIRAAAEIATRDEAPVLIKEVITPEVRKAVDRESGTIQNIAGKAANDRVTQTIDPLAREANDLVAQMRIQELIARAGADDAIAFDELLRLRDGGSPSQQELAKRVIADRYLHARDRIREGSPFGTCQYPTSSSFLETLKSADPTVRLRLAADCESWRGELPRLRGQLPIQSNQGNLTSPILLEKQAAPEIVKLALNDQSLAVRAQAIEAVNILFKDTPGMPQTGLDMLDKRPLEHWWHTNESNYRLLLLLSRSRRDRDNYDNVYLYEALNREKSSSSSSALEKTIDTIADGMPEVAARQRTKADLEKEMGRNTCSGVESDLDVRLNAWRKNPTGETYDSNGRAEILYLQYCPSDPKYLPKLVELATTSDSLSERYSATQILNQWLNLKLDPLNAAGIRAWWANNEPPSQK